jgi:prepilin-type N-terminal cleavage/methylation domain-containing protein
MKIFLKKNKGFTIIEVLIASLIISTMMIAVMSATSIGIQLSERALRQVQASMLAEEGVEVIKIIRDNGWTSISGLSTNTDYYISFDSNWHVWTIGTTPVGPIDEIFTRKIVFSNVSRDSNDDIASSGSIDTGIKKVSVTVSWLSSGVTVSKNITFYITNIFN